MRVAMGACRLSSLNVASPLWRNKSASARIVCHSHLAARWTTSSAEYTTSIRLSGKNARRLKAVSLASCACSFAMRILMGLMSVIIDLQIYRVKATWHSLPCSLKCALLPGVLTHQLNLLQQVSLHRSLQIFLGRVRWKVQAGVERVQLEEVAVRAGWRAGAAVADAAKVRRALLHPVRKRVLFRHAFLEAARLRRDVPRHPVHPGAHRCIRVVGNERQALGLGRDVGPAQGRGHVRPVARVLLGNHPTGLER